MWIIQEVVAPQSVVLHYDSIYIDWSRFANAMRVLSSHGLRNFPILLADRERKGRSSNADNHNAATFSSTSLRNIDNALVMESLRQLYGGYRAYQVGKTSRRFLPLEDVLQLCLRFDSTLAVDRLFALMGLVNEEDRGGIIPDYTKTPEAVVKAFTRAASVVLRKPNPFRGLRFAGVGRDQRIIGLPSWAPDWTAGIQAAILSHGDDQSDYKASLDTVPRLEFAEELRTVRCFGIVFDKVNALGDIFRGTPTPKHHQFRDSLCLLQHLCSPNHRYSKGRCNGQSLDEAFYRTLIGDTDPIQKKRPAPDATEHSFLAYWKSTIINAETALSDDLSSERREEILSARRNVGFADNDDNLFAHMLSTDLARQHPDKWDGFTSIFRPDPSRTAFFHDNALMAFGRRMCVSEKGYVGLVPANTAVGDQIAILAGAGTPYLLRETGGKRLLVGECYIHGAMDGEVFEEAGGVKALRPIILS
ncbi:hypothetical protein B0T16DRAFT_104087 [Cercophora newfieldiana]|uniref:Heterokaryon incompatibility domain-containing protein n=1 Tax=Cercophora newfieldiana TaxID=92897 RepID=A0AA39YH98_9PEZI|nr:hypothetical protein B0T16DRAFT_104087 [Cercophora newfieldiana]